MSSTHTPGRLTVGRWLNEKAGAAGWDLVVNNHRLPLSEMEGEADEAAANARRLVACWNALTSFTTEGIEAFAADGVGMVVDPAIYAAEQRMQALVDALAKTETYLLERLASNPGSTGATVILPMIRRAIEGAGVAPTQSGWGDV